MVKCCLPLTKYQNLFDFDPSSNTQYHRMNQNMMDLVRRELLGDLSMMSSFKVSKQYDDLLNTLNDKIAIKVLNDLPNHVSIHRKSSPKSIQYENSSTKTVLLIVFNTDKLYNNNRNIIESIYPVIGSNHLSQQINENKLSEALMPLHEYFGLSKHQPQPKLIDCYHYISPSQYLYGSSLIYWNNIDINHNNDMNDNVVSDFEVCNADLLLRNREISNYRHNHIVDSITALSNVFQFSSMKIMNKMFSLNDRDSDLNEDSDHAAQYSSYSQETSFFSYDDFQLETSQINNCNVYAAYGITLMSSNTINSVENAEYLYNKRLIRYALSSTSDFISDDSKSNPILIFNHIINSLKLNQMTDSLNNEFGFSFEKNEMELYYDTIQEYLSKDVLISLLCATLLEYHIIVVSSHHISVISMVCEWIYYLIRSITDYCHLFIPSITEEQLKSIISCPTPFLVGYYGNNISSIISPSQSFETDVKLFIVDIDHNNVMYHCKDYNKSLKSFSSHLKIKLNQFSITSFHCDDINIESKLNRLPNKLSRFTFNEILYDYLKNMLKYIQLCCWEWPLHSDKETCVDTVFFNEELYLNMTKLDKSKESSIPDTEFNKEFVKTQLFANALHDIAFNQSLQEKN